MTFPRVIELPRRLEPVACDTFLGVDAPRPVSHVGNVVALRPGDGFDARTPAPPQPPQPPSIAA